MGFFLGLLKLLFGKLEPWTPLFMLSDCEDDEGPQLRFDCEGDYTGECCEILDRLCAGRFAAIWMEDLFWMEQPGRKRGRARLSITRPFPCITRSRSPERTIFFACTGTGRN